MAGTDNTLTATLRLRYGDYSSWVHSNRKLAEGEAAVAVFKAPTAHTLGETDDVPANTPPVMGLKIGDGTKTFNQLPWVQAVASDVYNWAKQDTKPTYTADEIDGLADFIRQHGGSGGGESGGGETPVTSGSTYRIDYNTNTQKYFLQYYNEEQHVWNNASGDEIDLSSILARIAYLENWANGSYSNIGNIQVALSDKIYAEIMTDLEDLRYTDNAEANQFVTRVTQTNGMIRVYRSPLSATNITSGILPTEYGGTGLDTVGANQVLVGSTRGSITTKQFVTQIDNQLNSTDVFATVGAIKDYVEEKTANLSGAMHFIGQTYITITNGSNQDPQIYNYEFSEAQPGDVILANETQEFVWTGDSWALLGDEGSYAIKGSIVNADISTNANIAISKINGLQDLLDSKVDAVAGKQLSTYDYDKTEKDKLTEIYTGAWENVIENIFLDGKQLTVGTYNNLDKSINIVTAPFELYIDDTLQEVQNNQLYLYSNDLNTILGARVPNDGQYENITITNKMLELSRIAKTGDIKDLTQEEDTYIIIDCGASNTDTHS